MKGSIKLSLCTLILFITGFHAEASEYFFRVRLDDHSERYKESKEDYYFQNGFWGDLDIDKSHLKCWSSLIKYYSPPSTAIYFTCYITATRTISTQAPESDWEAKFWEDDDIKYLQKEFDIEYLGYQSCFYINSQGFDGYYANSSTAEAIAHAKPGYGYYLRY